MVKTNNLIIEICLQMSEVYILLLEGYPIKGLTRDVSYPVSCVHTVYAMLYLKYATVVYTTHQNITPVSLHMHIPQHKLCETQTTLIALFEIARPPFFCVWHI